MPAKQSSVTNITKELEDANVDTLKQVRDYIDNRLHEKDPNGSSKDNDVKNQLGDMSQDDLIHLRDDINGRLEDQADSRVSSADASADDEKRKLIAQHGSNPLHQQTAQSVPQPVSDDVKDLQNKAAEIEHKAKGPAADGSH